MASILVIDDDRPIRKLMRVLLELKGHVVAEADDGDAGIDAYLSSKPDLVFCDINMPRMGGLETLIDLRQRDPAVRVVAMSGGWSKADTESFLDVALHLGAISILPKPFTSTDLFRSLHDTLNPRSSDARQDAGDSQVQESDPIQTSPDAALAETVG